MSRQYFFYEEKKYDDNNDIFFYLIRCEEIWNSLKTPKDLRISHFLDTPDPNPR